MTEYITADIWADTKECRHMPFGQRGWIVVEGDNYATLVSPASLASFRLKLDTYDALRKTSVEFSPSEMIERIKEKRADFDRSTRRYHVRHVERALAALALELEKI